jgi:acetyl esterase/lipase
MTEARTHVYKAVPGLEIRADVYRAVDAPPRAPVVVHLHGGALIMGTRKWINRTLLEKLVAAACVVVSVDYRLAPETKLPSIMEDIDDAFRWVRDKGPGLFGIDPSRLAVTGSSAGGYLTLMTGFRTHPRPKALAAFYGYGDIIGDWYTKPDPFYCRQPAVSRDQTLKSVGTKAVSEPSTDRDPFYLYCRQQGLWPKEVAGFDPIREAAAFTKYCPLRNVTPGYPPTMLLHGDADTDVPYEQSVMMADALTRAGVRNELITIPGGPHGFDAETDKPAVAQALDRAIGFILARIG